MPDPIRRITSFLAILACFSLTATVAQAQTTLSDEDWAKLREVNYSLTNVSVAIAEIIDPANHQCCTKAPPETVDVTMADDTITVKSSDSSHWFNFSFPLELETPTFSGETSATVANIADVKNTFTGEVNEDSIEIEVTLGADGKLFGEQLRYSLTLGMGNEFTDVLRGHTVSSSVGINGQTSATVDRADPFELAFTASSTAGAGSEGIRLLVARYHGHTGKQFFAFDFDKGKWVRWDGDLNSVPTSTGAMDEDFALNIPGGVLSPGRFDFYYGVIPLSGESHAGPGSLDVNGVIASQAVVNIQ